MQNLHEFLTYRAVITEKIRLNASSRGYQKNLAEAAGCQPPYLSKALKGECQLTLEHGAGLARFWGFDELQTSYWLDLINLDRAGTPVLQQIIENRLRSMREQLSALGQPIVKGQGRNEMEFYYGSWFASALHILCSLLDRQDTATLASRLNVPIAIASQCLLDLQRFGFVECSQDGKWQTLRGSVHVDRGSIYNVIHLANWRQKALLHLQNHPQKGGIHYTSLHSLSSADFQNMQQELIKFINNSHHVVASSREEVAACINIDFFEI